jgi:CMP/dCMP kinase
MKITISGNFGSGKSTVGKLIAKKLNYDYYYTGNKMREMAIEKGVSLLEFTEFRTKNPSINIELDAWQKKIGETKNNFVLDGHVGFVFVPDSIKIFLKCPTDIAAIRILKSLNEGDAQRNKEGIKNDKQTMIQSLIKRNELEVKQYKDLYNVDFNDETNFDIVIDTTSITPEETCDKVISLISKKILDKQDS